MWRARNILQSAACGLLPVAFERRDVLWQVTGAGVQNRWSMVSGNAQVWQRCLLWRCRHMWPPASSASHPVDSAVAKPRSLTRRVLGGSVEGVGIGSEMLAVRHLRSFDARGQDRKLHLATCRFRHEAGQRCKGQTPTRLREGSWFRSRQC